MTLRFKCKVVREGIVDTRKYRYVYRDGKILRIELQKLDTVAALTDWVEV